MRDLDDTDREILRLLLADARRPYADIAEHVGLSPPAVSDRVERLREWGVIEGFTLELDRSTLREGVEVLVELTVAPDAVSETKAALAGLSGVEHLFETADGTLFVTATAPDGDVRSHFSDTVDFQAVQEFSVHLLADQRWHPGLGEASLDLACAECGNRVTSEGVTSTLDGERYAFCCTSCQDRFVERYEELKAGV
jgi:Lrp/AsnC family leucine-responsive transcriptional regulator